MRRTARSLLLCLLGATLGGCATTGGGHRAPSMVEVSADPGREWKERIDSADAARLAALPARWASALAAARPRFAAALAREGALLDPTRALSHPALPPGAYRCRLVTLGASGYRSAPPGFCQVGDEGTSQSFARLTGTERPSGWLFPDGDTRLVFLGAYATGKARAPVYGAAPGRSVPGLVERIAPFRWRLTLLPAGQASGLTVYDITPVPAEQQRPAGE